MSARLVRLGLSVTAVAGVAAGVLTSLAAIVGGRGVGLAALCAVVVAISAFAIALAADAGRRR